MEKIRLQKIIADAGYCSRRKAEEYIANGQVKVNGRVAGLGDKADPRNDLVTVCGEKINSEETQLRYIKLYKPRGYVTTMADQHGRKIVTELLTDVKERVYPIGRLDRNSEGLLLLTNDGAFANDIMHPTHHVSKTYRVTIPSAVTEEQLEKMAGGVEIEEGVVTQPCTINVLVEGAERTVLEFIIKEGKNRQIRKMCAAVSLEVSRLRRTNIGGVKLGMLKPGEYADLTKEELRILRASAGKPMERNGRKKK
ncbi:MAG: pseudouridine synthase [Ruminiclostridium sp.]